MIEEKEGPVGGDYLNTRELFELTAPISREVEVNSSILRGPFMSETKWEVFISDSQSVRIKDYERTREADPRYLEVIRDELRKGSRDLFSCSYQLLESLSRVFIEEGKRERFFQAVQQEETINRYSIIGARFIGNASYRV